MRATTIVRALAMGRPNGFVFRRSFGGSQRRIAENVRSVGYRGQLSLVKRAEARSREGAQRSLLGFARKKSTTASDIAAVGWKERAQVDTMVYVGVASFFGWNAFEIFASDDTKRNIAKSVIGWYRNMGVKSEHISDSQLVNDYMKKYMAACINCLLASPAFYFLYHLIHQQGFAWSVARSFTGTVRIIPIMAVMYGATAAATPVLNEIFQSRGQSYAEATSTSQVVVLIGGMSFLESIVELQGCGVPLSNITPTAILVFMPALIGRIVAGVFVQASKTGQEFNNVLPSSWASENAPEWQRRANGLFNTLCIDTSFFVTLFGTGVCQYILNGVTFVLLQKGRAMTLGDVGRYVGGGINGSPLSAVNQFGKTLGMRFGFCSVWNWCSSQPLVFPNMDAAVGDV